MFESLRSRRGRRTALTTTEELRLEVHVVERVDSLIVVGLDLSCNATAVSKLKNQGGAAIGGPDLGIVGSKRRDRFARRSKILMKLPAQRSAARDGADVAVGLTLGDILESLVSHDCG